MGFLRENFLDPNSETALMGNLLASARATTEFIRFAVEQGTEPGLQAVTEDAVIEAFLDGDYALASLPGNIPARAHRSAAGW